MLACGLWLTVSATLIQTPSDGNVLLDAGESTYGQLKRRFGSSEIDRVIGNLRLVFISHLHADHHMGLSKLLVERRKVSSLYFPPL